ncbi:MAG: DUF5103 domain-containing protein, partial [Sphingobacteriales bacterium]|nr:DUF5103 domain-containing protein [Sphingobacteriales bacterium]
MVLFKSLLVTAITVLISISVYAQDQVYGNNIKTVRFNMAGDQLAMPVYNLNSGDQLELHFDDLDADVKSYYYTYQLCDINWQPVDMSQFNYLKGFTQMRISNYHYSSLAYTRYTHYQAILPDANLMPTRSGNYMVKVYLDGDTSQLVLTRRMLVLNPIATVAAQIVPPFSSEYARTYQRLKFAVNIDAVNSFNTTQEIKVVVLQNNRWD